MIRSCIVCRKRSSPKDLLRLQLNTDREIQIVTTKKPHQRSAWICCDLICIQKLQKRSKALKKINPATHPSISELSDQAKHILQQKCRHFLISCHRSGQVVTGPKKVIERIDKCELILTSNRQILQRWKGLFSHKPIYSLDISSQTLGNWLGKGPRQVIGLLPNRHLQLVNEYLHLWGKLR